MNEPPGARWRVPLTALTIAEYFRDQKHQNVLLLMDNVFRFVQAGSEVSGLLGRLPSRVGYQPTLATEVAALAGAHRVGRRRGGHRHRGRLRPGRRLHRSGGDGRSRSHMDSIIVLSRDAGRRGHLPGGRPARLIVGPARSPRRRRGALSSSPSEVREVLAHYQGPAGRHRTARRGGARRDRPADRQARAPAAAFPHASRSP